MEREAGEGKERSWGWEGEVREEEGKGFAGPMSNYFLRDCERLRGKTYYLFMHMYPRNGHIQQEAQLSPRDRAMRRVS